MLGSFAISRGRYRELQFERVAGAVHYDDQRLGVDVAVEQAPGVTMAVNGSVPLALFTSSEATAADAGPAGGGSAPIDLNIESSAIGLQVVTGLTTGHRAGDRDRDGEAARHRHRRQPAVRRRRDPERRRLHRAGDRTALQRSHDAHHVRAGPDEGRRPQGARRGRRCAAGQRRPRPAPAGLRRRPDARPGAGASGSSATTWRASRSISIST